MSRNSVATAVHAADETAASHKPTQKPNEKDRLEVRRALYAPCPTGPYGSYTVGSRERCVCVRPWTGSYSREDRFEVERLVDDRSPLRSCDTAGSLHKTEL